MRLFTISLLLWPVLLGAQTRYASEALNMRAGASDRARVLTSIAAGSAVDVRDCDRAGGEWCLVVYNAQRGFVEARLLDTERSAERTQPLVGSQYSAPSTVRTLIPRASSSSRGYFRGPRGGCYTYSASGRKRYVDHSLCN
jgi:uncharacterized protein YraI